jgi:hypothetical protein
MYRGQVPLTSAAPTRCQPVPTRSPSAGRAASSRHSAIWTACTTTAVSPVVRAWLFSRPPRPRCHPDRCCRYRRRTPGSRCGLPRHPSDSATSSSSAGSEPRDGAPSENGASAPSTGPPMGDEEQAPRFGLSASAVALLGSQRRLCLPPPNRRIRRNGIRRVTGITAPYCAAARRFWDLPLAVMPCPMDPSPTSQCYRQGLRNTAVA